MSELAAYDYDLPKHLIAQEPLARRADARLMVVDRSSGDILHSHVRNLSEFVRGGDCIVLNDTKVLPARVVGYRTKTRGRWQGLYLGTDEVGLWKMLCKTRGRLAPGELITLQDRDARDIAQIRLVVRLEEGVWLVRPEEEVNVLELLERIGRVPLPHYIREGEMNGADLEHYQTIYARTPGAIAAPTAGQHFTKDLLARLLNSGVTGCRVTLHVGTGTFRPISVEQLDQHRMHSEWGKITAEAVTKILQAKQRGGRTFAIGTTSVRVLETAAANGQLVPWSGETDLFIRPPYRFRAVDALMTNFHLPRTTLLVLVRTFGGDELIRKAYQEAIEEQYRFYSYGDAMLIL